MPGFTGPQPNPDRVRRNYVPGSIELPLTYNGDYPSWPLASHTDRELELWDAHWRFPQAHMWVRQAVHFTLARYIQIMVMLEGGANEDKYVSVASTNLYAEMRQMENALGISSAALARLKWEVPGNEVAEQSAKKAAGTRGRLRAVDPSVANK